MNLNPPLGPWATPLGWLALEATVVVLAALAWQPFLRAAATRRSLWRAVLVALLGLLAAELTGTSSQLPAQLRATWAKAFAPPALFPSPATPAAELSANPPPRFPLATLGEGRGAGVPAPDVSPFETERPAARPPAHSPTLPPAPPLWPAAVWLAGLAALLARSAWTHAGFAWLRFRHFLPAAEALRERVAALAARLGLRRRVRVLTSERLRTPAAFGWVRPGVAVPGDFTARFAPVQQDVMLAHELAHLAARDPLWQLLADLVTAALWWHPLVWVARRQHRIAGELAADDASLALPNGPVVLAECLLVLGHEAADCPRAALGMAGFRSQLGRRVERLLALPRRDWQAPSRARLALQTAVALLALAALALLPGCAANRTAGEAPSGIVAKWWQAKKAPTPVGDDVRSLQSNAERGTRNAESSQRLVTSSPTAEEEGRARLSQRAALTREMDEQRKAMLAEHQRAEGDYKKLIESAVDRAVSIEERDKRKKAAEAKLGELQQIEVRIGEFDRDARARLGDAQRKLRAEITASQRLVTSSPTNALDISVGRQLFVDDFLIASNTLKRTWHQPILFSNTPLLARHDQIPPLHPFFESVWFDATNQLFMLGLANGTRFFTDYHSPSGTNWVPMHAQSHQGPLVEQPHRRVTTDYESLRVSLSRDAGTDGIQFGFARAGTEPVPQAGRPAIPLPVPTDGSQWTDMHPLRNGFMVVGRNLYCYFGGKITNFGPRITVPGFHQEQAAIGLATLRRDGFASLDAGPEGGVLTTKPVTFTGKFMFVNFKTNAPDGEMRIEILDTDGNALERFSRATSIALAADQTLMGVSWQNGAQDLSALIGKPVRFRFHLKNASLYSFWVGPGQLGRSMGRVAGGGPHFTNDVDTIGNASYRAFPVVRTNTPAPLGDDVRRLTSPQTPDAKPQTPPASQRLVTSLPTVVQLAAASPKSIVLPVPNPYAKTNSQVPFLTHSSKGAQGLNRKLDQIVLPEVHFDGVPLAEVVKRLDADVRKFDPEPDPKLKGVNFLINDTARPAPLLDATGNPVPPAQPVALSEGLVRLSTPLRHLTLRQVLDVICKTADVPTRFSVEEYAIAFIPRGPGGAYFSRTFRVNPDTFMQGLRGVVATLGLSSVNPRSAASQNQPGITGPVRVTVPATVPAGQPTATEANALVRQFFLQAGVTSLGATNSATQVQFNPQTGALVVHGTADEVRDIEQAIRWLESNPPGKK